MLAMALNRSSVAIFFLMGCLGMLCWAARFSGLKGIEGALLGLGGTGLSFGLGWFAIKMGAQIVAPSSAPAQSSDSFPTSATLSRTRFATGLLITVVLLKLPIIVACGTLARTIGGGALTTFLAGLGLVYFALFGWALLQR